jgi:3'-5' exoribonuclease
MLQAKLAQFPNFPQELKVLVEHLIISHHGEYEFGSPKLPMFPEALMLHYLDNLDSKMESMRAHFEREIGMESPWTGYNSSLSRPLLNSTKFLEKKPAAAAAAADLPAASGAIGSSPDAPSSPGVDLPAAGKTSAEVAATPQEKF